MCVSVISLCRPHETVVPLEDPIVTEVTSTLQEWALLWKQLYVVGSISLFTVCHCKTFIKLTALCWIIAWRKRAKYMNTSAINKRHRLKVCHNHNTHTKCVTGQFQHSALKYFVIMAAELNNRQLVQVLRVFDAWFNFQVMKSVFPNFHHHPQAALQLL